jgi:DNA polymerase-3 subunit epsilon
VHFHFFIGGLLWDDGVRILHQGGTLRNPSNGGRITEIPYVAADVETTGLSAADGHRVCEFALLRFLRGTVIDSFVSLVNPLRPIDPGASAVNGITDAMVAGAPTFADLLPRILDFLADDPLVFHNAPFDLSFLQSEARLAGGSWPRNRVIDTLPLARRTGRFRSNSLSSICRELGIGSTFHRAEADAWAAGKLLIHLVPDGNP